MHWIPIFRIAVLSWASLISFLSLALGGHLVSSSTPLFGIVFDYSALAIACGVLGVISIPVMLIIDFIRTGAITSLIIVELTWLSFMGVMFLALGGTAASAASVLGGCSTWHPDSAIVFCQETSVLAAFGFLTWLPLWAYTITLLVFLILHAQRGHYIWRKSVREAKFEDGIPPATTVPPVVESKPYESASLTPQTQYAYPPAGAPAPSVPSYGAPGVAPYANNQPLSPQSTGGFPGPLSPQPTGPYGQPGAHQQHPSSPYAQV